MLMIEHEDSKKPLHAACSKLLVARIDNDVARSMPNIHQSIPSSALVRIYMQNI